MPVTPISSWLEAHAGNVSATQSSTMVTVWIPARLEHTLVGILVFPVLLVKFGMDLPVLVNVLEVNTGILIRMHVFVRQGWTGMVRHAFHVKEDKFGILLHIHVGVQLDKTGMDWPALHVHMVKYGIHKQIHVGVLQDWTGTVNRVLLVKVDKSGTHKHTHVLAHPD